MRSFEGFLRRGQSRRRWRSKPAEFLQSSRDGSAVVNGIGREYSSLICGNSRTAKLGFRETVVQSIRAIPLEVDIVFSVKYTIREMRKLLGILFS